jgi:hypothetical protein
MGRQFGSNCSLNSVRSVLNRANSKQDRAKCVLISGGVVLNWIHLICIRLNCTLNFVEHGLNSADHGLKSGKTRQDCPDLRQPRVDSQSYLSGRINDASKTRLLRAGVRRYLQFWLERFALHWSHISPDLGFSLLDS